MNKIVKNLIKKTKMYKDLIKKHVENTKEKNTEINKLYKESNELRRELLDLKEGKFIINKMNFDEIEIIYEKTVFFNRRISESEYIYRPREIKNMIKQDFRYQINAIMRRGNHD